MSATDFFRAVFYPLTESRVLIPLLVFWLLISLASVLISLANVVAVLGLYLMIVTLPAVFRYLMIVLEARAKGRSPATPDTDSFNWFGNAWTVFPLFITMLMIWASILASSRFGLGGAAFVFVLASAVVPASFVVLAITHSPLQSLNPVAIGNLWSRCGHTFWIASVYLVLVALLDTVAESLPSMLANLVQLFLTFSFFSLSGSLVRPYDLIDDVYLPDEPLAEAGELASGIARIRDRTLAHAYGFVSRGNREGGFKYIFDGIDKDDDPVTAWSWYFERMLSWDDRQAALFFAQHYVHDLLLHSENVVAMKVILRCRLINERWKPKSADLTAAIEAAETGGNSELAAVLKRL